MIRISYIEEPELEFGGGARHVDIRFGLLHNGPFDAALETRPKEIRIGIVGTVETVEKTEAWIDQCRKGIDAKPSKQPNLFPPFPGLGPEGAFKCPFWSPETLQRVVLDKDLHAALAHPNQPARVRAAAELFAREIRDIAETGLASVVLVALPIELLVSTYVLSERNSAEDVGETSDESEGERHALNFRGVLKAACMPERVPIQLLWPSTADPSVRVPRKIKKDSDFRVQDDATRAWNMATALYYKAGGLPWRLTRNPQELRTTYVGVSFFRSIDRETVQTSTAQMFDERGEGVILRGGTAAEISDDRRPHLSEDDAADLLARSLKTFRHQHGYYPARVVLHKSSNFDEAEISGFNSTLDEFNIDYADYVYVAPSFIRLYRRGDYPPLRGTLIRLDPRQAALYTKGSVEFFRTYPGLYVPRPLLLRAQRLGQPMTHIAAEILALSKMNWNNTQFDGGRPVTLVASDNVGEILKYLSETDLSSERFATRYSFYM